MLRWLWNDRDKRRHREAEGEWEVKRVDETIFRLEFAILRKMIRLAKCRREMVVRIINYLCDRFDIRFDGKIKVAWRLE